MDWDLQDELRELLAEGRKIDAVKRYREHSGASLAEATDAIEALERDGKLPRESAKPTQTPIALENEIVSLVEQDRTIEAIKIYREFHGGGLKESKEAVEAIAAQHGIKLKSGCLGMLLLCAAIIGFAIRIAA